jgi:hypothetical protein
MTRRIRQNRKAAGGPSGGCLAANEGPNIENWKASKCIRCRCASLLLFIAVLIYVLHDRSRSPAANEQTKSDSL